MFAAVFFVILRSFPTAAAEWPAYADWSRCSIAAELVLGCTLQWSPAHPAPWAEAQNSLGRCHKNIRILA